MASERLPDIDGIDSELADVQRRLRDLVEQHDALTERMAACPNDFGLAWARSLAAEIDALDARIAATEARHLIWPGNRRYWV